MNLGTRLYTWLRGTYVGSDPYGNRYYRAPSRIQGRTERRWVVYNGEPEASKVPPEWHGWLHYTVDVPPTEEHYKERPWERAYEPNLTGTPGAYRPPGSLLNPDAGKRPLRDYEPWQPS
jgi:NADH:ubiquinone oxidoreductase subunit